MNYRKIEDHPSLVRDSKTNAIINKDQVAYKNYVYNKEIKENQNNKIEKIESNLSELKTELEEIKNLLRNLVK
jgi:hypothetical protein